MYDYDDDEVELIGWDPFVTRQWELLFAGYKSGALLRTSARRWADLLVGGASCTDDLADDLVRDVVLAADAGVAPEDARDASDTIERMLRILARMRGESPDDVRQQLEQLYAYLHEYALGS